MTEKLQQIIKEEVTKLPREAQDAINAFDWANIAEEIGKKYLLEEGEINDLQVETLLVLTGLESGEYYAQNIEDEIGTSEKEAEKIAEEAFQKIFTPISEAIVENIKRSNKSKNPNWEQSLDFILSGGDYSVFLSQSPHLDKERAGGSNSGGDLKSPPRSNLDRSIPQKENINPPSLKEIKDKLAL